MEKLTMFIVLKWKRIIKQFLQGELLLEKHINSVFHHPIIFAHFSRQTVVQKQNNRLRHLLKSAHLCEKVGAEEEKQKKEKTNYLYITGLYYRCYAHKSTIADHYNYCKKSRNSYIQTTMGVQFFYCANFAQTRQKSVCKGNKVNRRRRVRALTLASGVTLP